MKNYLMLLLLVTLFLNSAFSQEIKEKKIFEAKNVKNFSAYDVKYHSQSGTYINVQYDTAFSKSKILSNKGNSSFYDYISAYDIVFDNNGNYYTTANFYNPDGNSKFFFIKNGTELKTYNNITYPFTKRDDGIYFMANENGKDVRVKYSFLNGDFQYGPQFDTISLVYFDRNKGITEGEPSYEFGFTKDGNEFYIGSKNGKKMLVVGNTEQKGYDDIISNEIVLDNNGVPCYIAKEIVNGKNNCFVVQGDKEYKKFNYASSPLVFDKDNNPVYVVSDQTIDYPTEFFVAKGNEVISKKFGSGIYDLVFSPDGKLVYTGTDTLADGTYQTTLFIDNKEIATYNSIWGINFKKDGTPLYTASTKEGKTFLVEGTKIISDEYSYISNPIILNNGKVAFTGIVYNYEVENDKSKTFYQIGSKKFGPFYDIAMGEVMPDLFAVNDKDEFVYLVTETNKKKGEDFTQFYAVGNDWKSEKYDYISELTTYKNDFYFTGNNYSDEKNSYTQIYKNGDKLGDKYESISDFNLDKNKGVITFIGTRKNKVYYCEIKL